MCIFRIITFLESRSSRNGKGKEKNQEDKGGTGISTLVNNIVAVIKQNVNYFQ